MISNVSETLKKLANTIIAIGIILGIILIILGIVAFEESEAGEVLGVIEIIFGIVAILASLFSGYVLHGFAEVVENTRTTANLLKKMLDNASITPSSAANTKFKDTIDDLPEL